MSASAPSNYRALDIITSCVHLASASVISFCLSRRVPRMTWRSWRKLSWSRLCVVLVLLDSWFFVGFSGILMTGNGTFGDAHACSVAICLCISIYVLSKILIYSFLSERVYIVWSGGNQSRRLSTPVYRVCCINLAGFVIVAVFMVLGRESRIREDGACEIGLKQSVGIGLVVYDLFLNVFMTVMFLWPLCGFSSHSGAKTSPKLRMVAKRTFYGATLSLVCSAANISILSALGGNELGSVCMSSCVSDVVINSVVLYWISSTPSTSDGLGRNIAEDRYSLPEMDLSVLSATVVPQSHAGGPEESKTIAKGSGAPNANGITSAAAAERPRGKNVDEPVDVKIPDELFDYIPKDHLGWRRSDDDDYEGERRTDSDRGRDRQNASSSTVDSSVNPS